MKKLLKSTFYQLAFILSFTFYFSSANASNYACIYSLGFYAGRDLISSRTLYPDGSASFFENGPAFPLGTHGEGTYSVAVSPDGSMLFSGGIAQIFLNKIKPWELDYTKRPCVPDDTMRLPVLSAPMGIDEPAYVADIIPISNTILYARYYYPENNQTSLIVKYVLDDYNYRDQTKLKKYYPEIERDPYGNPLPPTLEVIQSIAYYAKANLLYISSYPPGIITQHIDALNGDTLQIEPARQIPIPAEYHASVTSLKVFGDLLFAISRNSIIIYDLHSHKWIYDIKIDWEYKDIVMGPLIGTIQKFFILNQYGEVYNLNLDLVDHAKSQLFLSDLKNIRAIYFNNYADNHYNLFALPIGYDSLLSYELDEFGAPRTYGHVYPGTNQVGIMTSTLGIAYSLGVAPPPPVTPKAGAL